jgi:MFS family permease
VGASSAQLSLALVCTGIGSILVMPFSGRMAERFSSAAVVRFFAALSFLAWVAVSHVPSVTALAPCMLLFGAGAGAWDVAMNVQGHAVEQRQRRVLMPKWHAIYSFGAVAGAAAGSAFARLGVDIRWQFPVAGALGMLALLWSTQRFISDGAEHEILPETADLGRSANEPVEAGEPGRGITRTEVILGLVVMATALGEGAANDWLGLMLVDTRDVAESFGALALAGFNVTMGVGRLVGARFIERWGRVAVLRGSGISACIGVLVLCFIDTPVTALLGAAAWGVGLAVVFPSGMSSAGEIPGRGARGIASVATIGYSGFLLGAPLIGQLTHVVSLDRALLVVAGAGLLIALLAPVARERVPRAAAA